MSKWVQNNFESNQSNHAFQMICKRTEKQYDFIIYKHSAIIFILSWHFDHSIGAEIADHSFNIAFYFEIKDTKQLCSKMIQQ